MKKNGIIASAAAAVLGIGAGLTLHQGYIEAFGPKGSRFVDPFRSKGHKDEYYDLLQQATDSMKDRLRYRYEILNDRGEKLFGYYDPCGDRPSG